MGRRLSRGSSRDATPRSSPACSAPGRPSPASRCARTCASRAAATRPRPARSATPGTGPGQQAGRPVAVRHWWPPATRPGGDDTGRAASRTLEAAGAAVSEISLPWHRDGLHVWNVIATDGATHQMIDGNAYGMNSPGLYDPELIAHYAKGRGDHGAEMSESLKL